MFVALRIEERIGKRLAAYLLQHSGQVGQGSLPQPGRPHPKARQYQRMVAPFAIGRYVAVDPLRRPLVKRYPLLACTRVNNPVFPHAHLLILLALFDIITLATGGRDNLYHQIGGAFTAFVGQPMHVLACYEDQVWFAVDGIRNGRDLKRGKAYLAQGKYPYKRCDQFIEKPKYHLMDIYRWHENSHLPPHPFGVGILIAPGQIFGAAHPKALLLLAGWLCYGGCHGLLPSVSLPLL